MDKSYGFPPVIDDNSKILILGSLPSDISISKNEYYGYSRNQFWRIIYAVFDAEPPEAYAERKQFLLGHGLALWDVLSCAERKGSLDSAIRNETPNDITGLLASYPGIRLIILNGGKAEQSFNKYFGATEIKRIRVPSTSPITGKNVKRPEEKLLLWKAAVTEGL